MWKPIRPDRKIAAISSEVATGRRMNRRDGEKADSLSLASTLVLPLEALPAGEAGTSPGPWVLPVSGGVSGVSVMILTPVYCC